MTEQNLKNSFVHRLPSDFKLALLCVASIALFFISNVFITAGCMVAVIGCYLAADLSYRTPFNVLRPLFWVIALVGLMQFFIAPPDTALNIILRLLTLILAAALVTLTTSTSAMIETFERIFQPLRYIGINPSKVSLTLSLTLRFIPLFHSIFNDVREAQKARGLEKSVIGLVVPVAVRMLKMSDDIAAAIKARGYDD